MEEESKDGLVTIEPEFIYFTIPVEYVCTYHKLIAYMADFGEEILKNCSASCSDSGRSLMNCWNMFQAALSCHNLDRKKEADLFINYINSQLKIIYNNKHKEGFEGLTARITPDGRLRAIVSCGEYSTFHVDSVTGELFQQYLYDQENAKNYSLSDVDLMSE